MEVQKVCPVCEERWIEEDAYCRYCGAPKDRPAFVEPDFACIYGPMPEERRHKCKKCGFTWKTMLMLDGEKFCPKCGGNAPVATRKGCFDFFKRSR